MNRSQRLLLVAGTVMRLAIGAGYLGAPGGMARAGFAPATGDRQDARLFVRAFGGHQVVTAGLTLAATRRGDLVGPALLLGALIDIFDVTSAVLEAGARGGANPMLARGMALSGTAAGWAVAVRALG